MKLFAEQCISESSPVCDGCVCEYTPVCDRCVCVCVSEHLCVMGVCEYTALCAAERMVSSRILVALPPFILEEPLTASG